MGRRHAGQTGGESTCAYRVLPSTAWLLVGVAGCLRCFWDLAFDSSGVPDLTPCVVFMRHRLRADGLVFLFPRRSVSGKNDLLHGPMIRPSNNSWELTWRSARPVAPLWRSAYKR